MADEKLVPKLRFNGFDDEWKISNFYSNILAHIETHLFIKGQIPY